jgi:hypothetical protein
LQPDGLAAGHRWRSIRVLTWGVLLAAPLFCSGAPRSQAQQPAAQDLALPPVRWAEAAAATEQQIINYDESDPLRYRVRRVDAKGETVREVIESRQGSVARLVLHNGQPLTAEEDADERQRLQAILDSPDAFLRHVHREAGSRSYAVELLRNMPKAMQWSYVPGQPQLPGASGAAVVLDFKPDPNFKPPSLITEALTGISGRVWVDVASHCVTRIQGKILHPVDFGWGGVLARIREGGYIELEQQKATDRRWLYSHLVEHITIREVLVHTTEENAEVTATGVHPLPAPLSVQDAVRMLLALPVPTR